MKENVLYLGYWYQRTSIHLSEIYDFLRYGTSPLRLNKQKLEELWAALKLKRVCFEIDVLEYINIEAAEGIQIRYYEDGLVIMSMPFQNINEGKKKISDYYYGHFIPAINYLFSLGAPIPKELVKTGNKCPYFLIAHDSEREAMNVLLKELGEKEYLEFKNEKVSIFRGDNHFVINSKNSFEGIGKLIEMFIFFSEFKAQLHLYLNLHRTVWEKIEKIKEQGYISGRNIERQRNELESYKKTIELIDGRLKQMGLYISSRENIVKKSGLGNVLTDVLEFKYENLNHNLDYIRSIWAMTRKYIDAAIQLFTEINQTSTKYAVNALTVISTIGIVALIITNLGSRAFPEVSSIGAYNVLLLLALSFLIHRVIHFIFKNIRYKISDGEL